jgi:hypothetical protein
MRSAVETFAEVTATVAPDTPFEHGEWGDGDVADWLRWLGHEFHHHETDVVARAVWAAVQAAPIGTYAMLPTPV